MQLGTDQNEANKLQPSTQTLTSAPQLRLTHEYVILIVGYGSGHSWELTVADTKHLLLISTKTYHNFIGFDLNQLYNAIT